MCISSREGTLKTAKYSAVSKRTSNLRWFQRMMRKVYRCTPSPFLTMSPHRTAVTPKHETRERCHHRACSREEPRPFHPARRRRSCCCFDTHRRWGKAACATSRFYRTQRQGEGADEDRTCEIEGGGGLTSRMCTRRFLFMKIVRG